MNADEKVAGPGGTAQKNWSLVQPLPNGGYNHTLPPDMTFNHSHVVCITVYSVLMVISATGNLTVLNLLLKRRKSGRASRLDFLLMHLAIADLLVTFLMMPLEIAWASTVSWLAGDLMCRAMMFCRTFGLYLSSFVLICISVDRYYAVLKPLCVTGEKRGRRALVAAWIGAGLASLPQSLIFHVDHHPVIVDYYQCVSYGSLTPNQELLYFLMNLTLMYLLPLFCTLYCYAAVLLEIVRRAKQPQEAVRRSGVGILGRARARTLKMTITILIVFFTCWSPYYCYCLWHSIDPDSAGKLDLAVQKALFIFSCTNSCANPIVYGFFNVRSDPKDTRRTNSCIRRPRLHYGDSMEISASTLAQARANLNSSLANGRRRSSLAIRNGQTPQTQGNGTLYANNNVHIKALPP